METESPFVSMESWRIFAQFSLTEHSTANTPTALRHLRHFESLSDVLFCFGTVLGVVGREEISCCCFLRCCKYKLKINKGEWYRRRNVYSSWITIFQVTPFPFLPPKWVGVTVFMAPKIIDTFVLTLWNWLERMTENLHLALPGSSYTYVFSNWGLI